MGTASRKLEDMVHELASIEVGLPGGETFESNLCLARLTELGTELWIDTGDLELARSVWKRELTSLTTNNTLANQVVQTGVMDEVIRKTAATLKDVAPGLSDQERVMEVGFVINCRLALHLVKAFHRKVSVELHPTISKNIEKTVYYGRRYYNICPEYFNIKIPLTPEGYLAVRRLGKDNIPINFTLGFSARQNYLAARLSNPDYVNVFLGRLNQVTVDNNFGSGINVGEKVTWATQKMLNEIRDKDPMVTTRLIGASIRNGEQVKALAGLDVLTVPPKAIQEFLDSGNSSLESGVGKEWTPGISSASERFQTLWDVTESFRSFVDILLGRSDIDSLTGADLLRTAEERDVDLFYSFTEADYRKIYDYGKIPNISDWPKNVALDDLMTTSALNSFAKDQDALDSRIRSFL